MSESTALTTIEEQLRRELGQLATQIEPPSSNKISVKGKVFKTPDGKSGPGPIEVVILDFVAVNMYYPGAYNPNNRAAPACFAIGKELKALAPPEHVKQRQNPTCETCPQNQWKSATNGNGKACKNQRRLVVIDPEFKGEPMTLYVSPTGIKQFEGYMRDLARDEQVLPLQVVTSISFDPNQSFPTLQFKMLERHGQMELAMKARAKAQEVLFKEPEAQAQAA